MRAPMFTALRIWASTDAGPTIRATATCGFRTRGRIGLLIRMAAGLTWIITDGRGSAMSRGDGLLITTGAGSAARMAGRGIRECTGVPTIGVRRWWDSSDGAHRDLARASVSDSATLDGCRWLRSKPIDRGTDAAALDLPGCAAPR